MWVTGTAVATRRFSDVFSQEVLNHWADSGDGRQDRPGLVVEIASNDGTFLQPFKERGWQVLGVDPARNVIERAIAAGVPTRCEFFTTEIAASIRREIGYADLVTARNVIPHVAEIHEVLEGVAQLLHGGGLAVIEFQYVGSILEGLQYDSIYHEHLFYFSLETLEALCSSHGLYPFDVFESPLSGGALVLLLAKEERPYSGQFMESVRRESDLGVNSLATWQKFGKASKAHSELLSSLISEWNRRGPVIGYGASARSSTLLNAAGVSVDQVVAIIDRNELKHGLLTPGSDIPIVSYEDGRALLQASGSLLLLAWNFESEIVADVRGEGFQGEILVPLPGGPRVI